MPKKQKYQIEIFIRDFQGTLTSCGKFETEVENYTLRAEVPKSLALSNMVSQFEIEFVGKVQD